MSKKKDAKPQPAAEGETPLNLPTVTVTATPADGKPGRYVAVAMNCSSELFRDTIDLNSATARKRFISGTTSVAFKTEPTITESKALRKIIDDQLTAFARVPPGSPTANAAPLVEVDVSRVARPELFHTPEVSGVTIAMMTAEGDKLAPRWRTFLRWADGKREQVDRPHAISLPSGSRVFLHPDPGEPATEPPPWSAEARKLWETSRAAPKPAIVFRQLAERIGHFLDLGDDPEHVKGAVAVLALWTMLTYVYPAWDSCPYLYVGGPKDSGKSRLLDVLSRLVFRSLVTSNLTAASLFRTLHVRGGTLFFDEAERMRQASTPDVQELLSVFLAGYRKGGSATRLEPVGDGFRPVQFDVYGPKVLACIAGLPPTLSSRCIHFTMFRAEAGSEKAKRRLDADPGAWAKRRDDLFALALEHGSTWCQLAHRHDVVPKSIANRNFELWQPLLALAEWLESHGANKLLELVQKFAVKTVEEAKEDGIDEADETLLTLLADAVRNYDQPTAGDLLEAAKKRNAGTFEKWQANTVTRRLKNYSIPAPKKSNGVRRFKVTREALERIQTRYGVDLGCGEDSPPGTDPDRP